MFLKIILNFDNGFFKKFIRFFIFYEVFSKNHIKMFLKIIINFDNGFFKTFIPFFRIL